jgi:hypothetical protein
MILAFGSSPNRVSQQTALTTPPAPTRARAKNQQEHPVVGIQRAIGNQGTLRLMRANGQSSQPAGPKPGATNQPAANASDTTVMRQTQPGETHFQGCTRDQQNLIDAVVQRAKRALNAAAAVVGSAYGRPDHLTPVSRQLLMEHFHTTRHQDLREILGTYTSISRAFDGGLKFKCESDCPPTDRVIVCGSAMKTRWFGGIGPIHLCFDHAEHHCNFATLEEVRQTQMVIHEAAHRFAGVADKMYKFEEGYATLPVKDAIDNADSYGWFAVGL